MDTEQFIARNKPRFGSVYWEELFVREVLGRTPAVDFDKICPQKGIQCNGQRYFVDFAIEEGEHVHIALEVDGWDKKGQGRGMNRAEFVAWMDREAGLQGTGWTVLRFANSQVRRSPLSCARNLELVLQRQRAIAGLIGTGQHRLSSILAREDEAELVELETERQTEVSVTAGLTPAESEKYRFLSEELAMDLVQMEKARDAMTANRDLVLSRAVIVTWMMGGLAILLLVGFFALTVVLHH